jgi:hypothetical protein
MKAYVVTERTDKFETDEKGTKRRIVWWRVFTYPPLEFNVYWRPDGVKTMEQFLDEQIQAIQTYLGAQNASESEAAR